MIKSDLNYIAEYIVEEVVGGFIIPIVAKQANRELNNQLMRSPHILDLWDMLLEIKDEE